MAAKSVALCHHSALFSHVTSRQALSPHRGPPSRRVEPHLTLSQWCMQMYVTLEMD